MFPACMLIYAFWAFMLIKISQKYRFEIAKYLITEIFL